MAIAWREIQSTKVKAKVRKHHIILEAVFRFRSRFDAK